MSEYPRTEEGFASAIQSASWLARTHGHKGMTYVLYVDKRWPDKYGVTLESIFDIERVELGTVACRIGPDKEMIELS